MKKEIDYLKENAKIFSEEDLKNLIKECPLLASKLGNSRLQHELLVDIFKLCLDKCEEYEIRLKQEIKNMINIDNLDDILDLL